MTLAEAEAKCDTLASLLNGGMEMYKAFDKLSIDPDDVTSENPEAFALDEDFNGRLDLFWVGTYHYALYRTTHEKPGRTPGPWRVQITRNVR